MTPGFPTVEEIPKGVNIKWLVVEVSGNAEAIIAVVDVEQIIKDAPL